MILHLYFARKFLLVLASVFTVFTLFTLLLELVEHVNSFDSDRTSFLQLLELAALRTPEALYDILPLIVLLSTLALFLGLARTSELVIARASGRSAIRALSAPVIAVFVVGILVVTVFNPLVAATSKEHEALADSYRRGTSSTLSISREGLWLRQGDETGQIVIRATHANLDGTELFDVTFLGLSPEQGVSFRIEAESAVLQDGRWDMTHAKRWSLKPDTANPEQASETFDTFSLPSDLTRERIRDSFGTPSAIPIWDLPDFIQSLERAGFSAMQHRVWMQMELALPMYFVAMVMVAAGFTMRHTRFGKTGQMVMMAVGLGLTLFYLRNFARVLGETGQIPVALAAWSPPVIGILLAMGLLLHLEDG